MTGTNLAVVSDTPYHDSLKARYLKAKKRLRIGELPPENHLRRVLKEAEERKRLEEQRLKTLNDSFVNTPEYQVWLDKVFTNPLTGKPIKHFTAEQRAYRLEVALASRDPKERMRGYEKVRGCYLGASDYDFREAISIILEERAVTWEAMGCSSLRPIARARAEISCLMLSFGMTILEVAYVIGVDHTSVRDYRKHEHEWKDKPYHLQAVACVKHKNI